MKKILAKSLIVIAALPFIASCSGSVRDTLGMRRSAPNEFRVVSNPPLSVPPEFTIRPPVPEEKYKQTTISKTEDAKNVLFEKASAEFKVKQQTAGEEAFSSLFNASQANPEIKSVLHQEIIEAAKKEEEKSFLEQKLLSKLPSFKLGKDEEKEADSIVDAKLEKDRITETKKLGEAVTGDETPTAETKESKGGFFNRILGL